MDVSMAVDFSVDDSLCVGYVVFQVVDGAGFAFRLM